MNSWLAFIEQLGGRLDGLDVVAAERRLQVGELGLDALLLVGRDLVALLPQELLGLVDERVGLVADLGLFLALTVLLGVGLGVLDHLVDVVLRRATTDR